VLCLKFLARSFLFRRHGPVDTSLETHAPTPAKTGRRLKKVKAPPPVARGAKIRSIANPDGDQNKLRDFPLCDVI
jgi:hypothetical protein